MWMLLIGCADKPALDSAEDAEETGAPVVDTALDSASDSAPIDSGPLDTAPPVDTSPPDPVDDDGDGYLDDVDCDDGDAMVFPGAAEICDGRQTDCDLAWASDAGIATWTGDDGAVEDWSKTLAAGTWKAPVVHILEDPGTLSLCGGPWYAGFGIDADITLQGYEDASLDGAQVHTIITLYQSGLALRIQDLTLQNGGADAPMTPWRGDYIVGGALACMGNSTVDLDNVQALDNYSPEVAGAMGIGDGCHLTVVDSLFRGNVGTYGATLTVYDAYLNITGSIFEENVSMSDAGAVMMYYNTAVITDTIIRRNTSHQEGGGMNFADGDLTFEDVLFEDNTAGDLGGALFYHRDADVSYTNVTFSGNFAKDAGAVAVGTDSYATFDSVRFEGNQAIHQGGAVLFIGASMSGTNVDFVDNSPEDVYHGHGDEAHTYGKGASFACDRDGCD